MSDKIRVPEIKARKQARGEQGRRLVALTAYDATMARLLDEGGADILMVGDSLGMVVQGRSSTLAVSVEDMIYHTRLVARGTQRAHIVTDMPFMSFQVSVEDALRNAGRLVKEGGAESVKLEGGRRVAPQVHALVEAGIPVMGHLGLTPQSLHTMGGFKVQGKAKADANRLMEDASIIADAGAYCLVLEGIPAELARRITQTVPIPTIGIGAGPHCDGQVLVCYDFLGMFREFRPKFVKRYADLGDQIVEATGRFIRDVQTGAFPDQAHSFGNLESVAAKAAGDGYGPGEE